MAKLTKYAEKRIEAAKKVSFGRRLTAYITGAKIDFDFHYRYGLNLGVARGTAHEHIIAEHAKNSSNGHSIRTSPITSTEEIGSFWVLHTLSGSMYVIATFDSKGGRQSLEKLNKKIDGTYKS